MEKRLTEDMERWGMHDTYAFAEELLIDSQLRMARHRLVGFDLIRSNPGICGFNLTGMLDHAFSGEGMWRMWRDTPEFSQRFDAEVAPGLAEINGSWQKSVDGGTTWEHDFTVRYRRRGLRLGS